MIIAKTQTFPGMRQGYLCSGKTNTNTSGVGTITFTGKDVSSKITGLSFSAIYASAVAAINVVVSVVSIAYSGGTTTITIQASLITDSGAGTTDLTAFDGDVYYSFWVNDNTLPTDESTNNPGTENL